MLFFTPLPAATALPLAGLTTRSNELAPPDRTRPSIAADLATWMLWSNAASEPAMVVTRNRAGVLPAELRRVKQPDSMAGGLISARGLPSSYLFHRRYSPSTTAIVPMLSLHLANSTGSSCAAEGVAAVADSAAASITRDCFIIDSPGFTTAGLPLVLLGNILFQVVGVATQRRERDRDCHLGCNFVMDLSADISF